jgi:TDG/mug DNA glycosylase family protein
MKPTATELLAAAGGGVPDLIAPRLRVLFCGINPGLYSGFTGHHFARPGNRFWPALYTAGFTDRLLAPSEEHQLLRYGYGITNLVNSATASAAELTKEELMAGAKKLRVKAERYQPRIIAILGISAYRTGFGQARVELGLQGESIGRSALWVLPNPSGLNAHYTPVSLTAVFRRLRMFIDERSPER